VAEHAVKFNFVCSALIDGASTRRYACKYAPYAFLIACFFLPNRRILSRNGNRFFRRRRVTQKDIATLTFVESNSSAAMENTVSDWFTGSLRLAVAINLHPIEFAIYLRARSVVADRYPIRRLTNRDSRKCQRLDEQVVCPCKRRRILSTLVRTVCINRFV